MIAEFRPRFFDLQEFEPKEVQLTPAEESDFDWNWQQRKLTRVRWDSEIDFVIEVGDHCHQFAIEELQRRMAAEYGGASGNGSLSHE